MSKRCAKHVPRRAVVPTLLALAAVLGGCATSGSSKPQAATELPAAVQSDYTSALHAMKDGNWASAQTLLQSLANAHPELPGPLVNLGITLAHQGNADDARKLLERATSQWPEFAPGQLQLGLLLRDRGEFAAADAAFAKAQAADPAYALAYYDRGVLNELYLQRPDVALQNYEKFQQLQPIADEQVGRWIETLRRRTGAAPTDAKSKASGGSS